MGQVGQQLQPVAEAELLDPLAVGRLEVAGEAGHDVVQAGGGERGEERPRVALAEEAARVSEPEALARAVLEPGEVVEVAAVRDHAHLPAGSKARTSSAIGSETATTASAERAISRTTCCSAFSFA